MSNIKKCPGSGTRQMLSWFPSETETDFTGKPYPGAVVCNHCSFGVLVVRGTVRKAVSMTGHEGLAGDIRVHYIEDKPQHQWPRMAYTKGELK